MSNKRSIAGRKAKLDGHIFEESVKTFFKSKGTEFIIEGAPNTKIDIRSKDNKLRYSVKKTPTDLQVGLITQNNFIDLFNIKNSNLLKFIRDFFGGDHVSEYPRHRKTLDDIPTDLSSMFLKFMNKNIENIFRLTITHGSLNQKGDVNYILFPTEKHNVKTLKKIDTKEMLNDFLQNGQWIYSPNKTSLHFYCNDVKVMSLQMFGSGPKYKSGYHSLQFRISCGKINPNYVTDV